jgi:hypothetical protein
MPSRFVYLTQLCAPNETLHPRGPDRVVQHTRLIVIGHHTNNNVPRYGTQPHLCGIELHLFGNMGLAFSDSATKPRTCCWGRHVAIPITIHTLCRTQQLHSAGGHKSMHRGRIHREQHRVHTAFYQDLSSIDVLAYAGQRNSTTRHARFTMLAQCKWYCAPLKLDGCRE